MIEIDTNLNEAVKRFEQLKISGTKKEEILRDLVSKVLDQAKDRMQESTRTLLPNDKREAWRAIKESLYKQILGGNISILSRRRAGKRAQLNPSRRGRSATTERYESYLGVDRSFILRILNAGSRRRVASTMNNHPIRRGNVSERQNRMEGYRSDVIGYRGVYGLGGARGFFSRNAYQAIKNASAELSKLICEEITKELNKL